jgi:hypothetical protein
MTRFANVNWMLPLMILPFFKSTKGTLLIYVSMVVAFVLVCVFALQIKEGINTLTIRALDLAGDSAIGQQLGRFWTVGARLDGLHDLATNGKMWTLFGYGSKQVEEMLAEGIVHSHDIVSTTLLKYGVIVLTVSILISAAILKHIHQLVLGLSGTPVFSLCLWLLCTEYGLIFHNVCAGNVTATFPVNFFFWFIAGAIRTCSEYYAQKALERVDGNDGRGRDGFEHPGFGLQSQQLQ